MQRILKRFQFDKHSRSRLTFSDATKIRLDNDDAVLMLAVQGYNRATGAPLYATDTDLTVTVAATTPQAAKQWLRFAAEPTASKQPEGAQVRYRLSDGALTRYWSGAAWAEATDPAHWNTEVEIAENISSFPATQELGLVINLLTTDDEVTPTLRAVDVLMDCDLIYFKSIVADSVVPSLRAGIRPIVTFSQRAPGGTKTTLSDAETPWNVLSIAAIYDHDNDPDHATDLLTSYDTTTKAIVLASAVERGTRLLMQLVVEPEIVVNWASQDYIEVSKLPAVVIERIDLAGNIIAGRQEAKDASAQVASVRRHPFRLSMRLAVRLLAESNATMLSMSDSALTHTSTTPLLPWPDVDERLTMIADVDTLLQGKPSLSDEHEAQYALTLHDIHLFLRPEEIVPLVQQVNISCEAPQLQGGALWTG